MGSTVQEVRKTGWVENLEGALNKDTSADLDPFVSLRKPSLLTHGQSFRLRHALSVTLGVIHSQPSQSLSVTLGQPWSPSVTLIHSVTLSLSFTDEHWTL